MRSFQLRILHRALVLNSHLYRWKMRDNNMCSFCNSHKETILHIFYYCDNVSTFWNAVFKWLQEYVGQVELNIMAKSIMLNNVHYQPGIVCNAICLFAKRHIYVKRCMNKSLNLQEFKQSIWALENTEKYHCG